MRRQYFFISFAAAIFLLVCHSLVLAQTGGVRGKVMLHKADGTTVPAENAVVDIYRLDLPGKLENIKANKNGEFSAIGLFIVGKYMIAASAPNGRPKVIPNVKAGQDADYIITLEPGDGRRLTVDEARQLANAGPSEGGQPSGESAEDRAKREEMIRKNEEVKKSNEKNTQINEIVGRAFKGGNEALQAKRFDDAIAQYNEGLAADPEQIALLTNKSLALIQRGVQRNNDAVKSSDDAVKSAGLEAAHKDWREAAESSTKAVQLAKAQAAATDPEAQKGQATNKYFALVARAEAMRLFATKVDTTKSDEAFAAFQDLIAVETDPAKKLKAQVDAAQMYFDSGNAAKAIEAFQSVLSANPDNLDATLGMGLALFSTGDKTKYQEAANYLQRFVDKAPDTHPLKASAKESLDYLKKNENVQPQRTGGATRRRG